MSISTQSFFSPHFKIHKETYTFWMLKQGYKHRMNFVIVPYSVSVVELLKIAYSRGFISGFQLSNNAIKIFLKWTLEGEAGIQNLQAYSKPSASHRLHYTTFVNMHIRSCAITPIWIFKTKQGYIDHFNIYKNKIGGDLIAIFN